MNHKKYEVVFGVFFVFVLFVGSFLAAHYIQDHQAVHDFIASFGYAGILLLAFVAGFNLLVPIPAVVFTPVFVAAGFSLPEIVSGLVIGTTAADLMAFYFGTLGKTYVTNSKKRIIKFFVECCSNRRYLTSVVVFVYAAAVPLPNELLLVPLGALGYRLRDLILPFFLGTVVHMTVLAYGIESIFEFIY